VTDEELDIEFVYFLFAYYFHYTPEQTDAMDKYRVDEFLIMLPKWIEKTKPQCPLMQEAK